MYWLQNIGPAIIASLWQSAIAYSLLFFLRKYRILTPQNTYRIGLAFQLIFCCLFFKNILGNANSAFQIDKYNLPISNFNKFISSNYISYSYIIIFIINSFYFLKKQYNENRLDKQDNLHVPSSVKSMVGKWKAKLNIQRPIHLMVGDTIQSPFTKGLFKPIIVLPLAYINKLDSDQMEAILLHELAHIKRYDYGFLLLQVFMEKIMYFNPFFLQIGKAINEDRELSCDIFSLKISNYNSINYVETLLLFTDKENNQSSTQLAIAGKENNELFNRAAFILQKPQKHTFRSSIALNIVAALAFTTNFLGNGNMNDKTPPIPLAIIKPVTEENTQVFHATSIQSEPPIVENNIKSTPKNIDNKIVTNTKIRKTIKPTLPDEITSTERQESIKSENSFVQLASFIQPNENDKNLKFRPMEISDNRAVFALDMNDPKLTNVAFEKLINNINDRFAIERRSFQYAASNENGQLTETYTTELISSNYRFVLIKGHSEIYLAIAPITEKNS